MPRQGSKPPRLKEQPPDEVGKYKKKKVPPKGGNNKKAPLLRGVGGLNPTDANGRTTPPLRVWLPEGKARRRGRVHWTKADSVGGHATEKLPPPARLRANALVLLTPPQGGSDSLLYSVVKPFSPRPENHPPLPPLNRGVRKSNTPARGVKKEGLPPTGGNNKKTPLLRGGRGGCSFEKGFFNNPRRPGSVLTGRAARIRVTRTRTH